MIFAHGKLTKRVRPCPAHHRRDLSLTIPLSHETEGWIEYTENGCFPRFLDLPRDIRDIIYELAMYHLPTRCGLWSSQTLSEKVVYPQTLPDLCFINRQLHKECLHAWLRRTRFIVADNEGILQQFNDFLSRVDGVRAVRMLSFPELCGYGQPYTGNTVSDLAAACPGLRKLSIEIKAISLIELRNPLSDIPDLIMRSPLAW